MMLVTDLDIEFVMWVKEVSFLNFTTLQTQITLEAI